MIGSGTTTTRVEVSDIRDIIDTKLGDTEIEAFILAANLIVTEDLSTKSVLSTERLQMIELYLSAHFVTLRDRRESSRSLGDGSTTTFEGQTGLFLTSSHYGQTAIMLDSTGTLSTIQATRKVASIRVVSSA